MKNFDLSKLNSITKYPSIPTYHEIQGKGNLLQTLTKEVIFNEEDDIEILEKIDGENTRQIFIIENGEVDYFIGTREEIIYAKGDRITNLSPYGNIVPTIKPSSDKIATFLKDKSIKEGLLVIYQEIYGGNTPHSREYTTKKEQSIRVFDMFFIPMEEVENMMNMNISRISTWRKQGKQPFMDTDILRLNCLAYGLTYAPLRKTIKAKELPSSLEDMYLFLYENFYNTLSSIDGLKIGKSEGIIVRTKDRKTIAKIRFEDYERTLDIRGFNPKIINRELELTDSERRYDFLARLLKLM